MARIWTDGGEAGDTLFFDNAGSWLITSTVGEVITGAFSYKNVGQTVGFKNTAVVSEFFTRLRYKFTNVSNITSVSWRKGTTTLGIVKQNALGQLALYTGTGTLVATGPTVLQGSTPYLIEIHVKIADTGGIIEVKLDGNVEASYLNGDTKPGTDTTIDNMSYGPMSGLTQYIDDLAFNDTSGTSDNSWCGDGRVIAVPVAGNGDVTQLTNSAGTSVNNYSYVDEIPAVASDYVESSTLDTYDLYTLAAHGLPSTTNIRRLWVSSRSWDTVAAGGKLSLGVKTNGSENWSSDISLLTSAISCNGTVYTVNPQSTSPWTLSELTALQIGPKTR